jgi:hypothetical protein
MGEDMTHFAYAATAALALAFTTPVHAGAMDEPAQDSSKTIIWPAQTPDASAKSPDSIIWNDAAAPASAGPPQSLLSPPSSQAPSESAMPDRNGIIWNDPPRDKQIGSPPHTPPIAAPPTSNLSARSSAPPRVVAGAKCREFQTEILIEGRRQPAYGTVCQQADGSWRVVNQSRLGR